MLADPIHMNKGKKVSYYIVLLCRWSLYVAIPFQHGIGSCGQSKLPAPMLGGRKHCVTLKGYMLATVYVGRWSEMHTFNFIH